MHNIDIIYTPVKKTASGIVIADLCVFGGFLLGTDGVNNPTITVFDNDSEASGEELVPTVEYDATALGLNGVSGIKLLAQNGIYIEISCSGNCEATVFYARISRLDLNYTQLTP